MTAREYVAAQNAKLREMVASRARETLAITFDLYQQGRFRINTRGQDYTGQQFYPYSPGWAKDRKKRGRQVAFVDFNDSGRLEASVRPKVLSATPVSNVIELSASGADNNAKLLGALNTPKAKPRGNILIPSAQEIANAADANRRRIEKYLI